MRILLAHAGAYPGRSGAEAMAVGTLRAVCEAGHAVALATDPRCQAAAVAPGEVLDGRGDWTAAAQAWGPDLVHLVDAVSAHYARTAVAAARACGVPLLVTPASAAGTWEDAAAVRNACEAAAAVFALTPAEGAALRRAAPGVRRVVVTGQGADLAPATRTAGEFRAEHGIAGPAVLFLGRRLRFKGLWRLVGAMARVAERLPGAVLVAAGPPGDDTVLDGVPLPPWVRDAGLLPETEKRTALEACTLLCLPTEHDVFPVSFVEAWSCARPVVTTPFAGVDHVVRHGRDGWVAAGWEGDALAAALVALLADPARCEAMGRAGRRRVDETLNWTAIGHTLAAVYDDVGRRRVHA